MVIWWKTINKNNKIQLSEKELKQLLDEVYWEGYKDGSSSHWTYTTPNYAYNYHPTWKDYITCTTTTNSEQINLKGE